MLCPDVLDQCVLTQGAQLAPITSARPTRLNCDARVASKQRRNLALRGMAGHKPLNVQNKTAIGSDESYLFFFFFLKNAKFH